jgi:hypothetical protein
MIKAILNQCPLRVASGPFRGTRCLFTSTGDGVVAKLAGTYECEIYSAFEHALRAAPSLVVDIGAAEGFYVAAFALALPKSEVLAYEAKEVWRARIRRLAELNGVAERCEIRGFCDPEEFQRLLNQTKDKKKFILMDIEGGEFDLITDESRPLLAQTELIVELHEAELRSEGDALIQAFSESHDVAVLWAKEQRDASHVGDRFWKLAFAACPPLRRRLDEKRAYQMRWLHAVPRQV